jgi:hypothetical protein
MRAEAVEGQQHAALDKLRMHPHTWSDPSHIERIERASLDQRRWQRALVLQQPALGLQVVARLAA